MSLFSLLFGGAGRRSVMRTVMPTTISEPGAAADIMRRFNRNTLIGIEDNVVVMIEDVTDPDGRMYRMEYQSTPDGQHATAFCRQNPWGNTPDAGESNIVGHVFEDGSICMGSEHYGGSVDGSPYTLETVIERSHYWCTAFSVLKETGEFPSP